MEKPYTAGAGAINKRIAETRKALALTQQEFAEGIKISQTHMGALELGQRRVNERILKIVTLTYGVNVEWLRTGEGEMFINVDERKLEQLMQNFKKLDGLLQDYVLKQLDQLLDYQEKRKQEGS
jgi:transcriptional regulator with XRE-family HTH domain